MSGRANTLEGTLREIGMTQADLARRIDSNPVTVNRWARGHHRPHQLYRKAIVKVLRSNGADVTVESLWP